MARARYCVIADVAPFHAQNDDDAEDPDGELMLDANGEYMVQPRADAIRMWLTLARFARAVSDEARTYSERLGVTVPHTDRTIKPAGTTSKLFGLAEGAHLPAMRECLGWVQFRNDDPQVAEYEAKGYPVKRLQTHSATTIVGFPTAPVITQLGMGDRLVTAPEEQHRYLRLLETFRIRGLEHVNCSTGACPVCGTRTRLRRRHDSGQLEVD